MSQKRAGNFPHQRASSSNIGAQNISASSKEKRNVRIMRKKNSKKKKTGEQAQELRREHYGCILEARRQQLLNVSSRSLVPSYPWRSEDYAYLNISESRYLSVESCLKYVLNDSLLSILVSALDHALSLSCDQDKAHCHPLKAYEPFTFMGIICAKNFLQYGGSVQNFYGTYRIYASPPKDQLESSLPAAKLHHQICHHLCRALNGNAGGIGLRRFESLNSRFGSEYTIFPWELFREKFTATMMGLIQLGGPFAFDETLSRFVSRNSKHNEVAVMSMSRKPADTGILIWGASTYLPKSGLPFVIFVTPYIRNRMKSITNSKALLACMQTLRRHSNRPLPPVVIDKAFTHDATLKKLDEEKFSYIGSAKISSHLMTLSKLCLPHDATRAFWHKNGRITITSSVNYKVFNRGKWTFEQRALSTITNAFRPADIQPSRGLDLFPNLWGPQAIRYKDAVTQMNESEDVLVARLIKAGLPTTGTKKMRLERLHNVYLPDNFEKVTIATKQLCSIFTTQMASPNISELLERYGEMNLSLALCFTVTIWPEESKLLSGFAA
mmetsp:Transcript_15011/g.22483  ORF Transcript_15011/g.22483 Transcript_15011/m.22483 type:complete len:554 (-) Transcript_15011:115-1776(-)